MSLKQTMGWYIFVWLVIVAAGYALKGDSLLFDLHTLVISAAIALVLWMGIKLSRPAILPQIALLTVFMGIYFLPRIAQYFFAPERAQFPFDNHVNVSGVNAGLLFILLGTAGIVCGLFAADAIARRNRPSTRARARGGPELSTNTLLLTFSIWLILESYIHFNLKINVFSNLSPGSTPYAAMALRILIGIDAAFFFVFGFLLVKDRRSLWERVLTVSLPIAYGLYLTLAGSKGAVLRISLMTLILLVCRYGDVRLRLRNYLVWISLIILLGPMTFYLGQELRVQQMRANDTGILGVVGSAVGREIELSEGIGIILDRLGLIDYPISIVSRAETRSENRYLTLDYVARSLTNIFYPGTVFLDADIPTSRVMSIIYRGYSEERVRRDFNSEYWTAWGLAYAYFGWVGGLLFLFVSAAILHVMYLAITSTSLHLKFVFRGWFLFAVMAAGFYGSMGFDHAFSTAIFLFGQMALIYAFSRWIGRVPKFRRVRSSLREEVRGLSSLQYPGS